MSAYMMGGFVPGRGLKSLSATWNVARGGVASAGAGELSRDVRRDAAPTTRRDTAPVSEASSASVEAVATKRGTHPRGRVVARFLRDRAEAPRASARSATAFAATRVTAGMIAEGGVRIARGRAARSDGEGAPRRSAARC
jgi:hypothetical protein